MRHGFMRQVYVEKKDLDYTILPINSNSNLESYYSSI